MKEAALHILLVEDIEIFVEQGEGRLQDRINTTRLQRSIQK
jgi:hypothetical protein